MNQRIFEGSSLSDLETKRFISFDGGVRERAAWQRPDRYRAIENSLGKHYRIPRGGGYSYAAASFGRNSIVQDMSAFDRILAFDSQYGRIQVEAGITLASLLNVTIPAGFWLPVIPGYPHITVGGCVAANVHGKNPATQGTFRNYIQAITLFHPAYGMLSVSEENHPSVFHLTCGGYGLTGVILTVTLRLEKLIGTKAVVQRTRVASLHEAYQVITESSATSEFAYSMHHALPEPQLFGRGYVSRGHIPPGPLAQKWRMPGGRVLTASSRGGIPPSLFGGLRTRCVLAAHWLMESARKTETTETLFDAMFPLARRWYYFMFYGRAGLAEYQVIIPHGHAELFLTELQRVLLKEKPPAVMCSLKLFKGDQQLLRFEMEGLCVALDLVRSEKTNRFLATLDSLLMASGGIPYLIKDSRLPEPVARRCYPQFETMKAELHRFDPERLFRSEMSERLRL
jgi:decaprenylphospho-beta-D-ribofuranose 2-oxidase